MITAIGLDVDSTLAGFLERCAEFGVPIQFVNLRAAVEGEWRFDLPAGNPAILRYVGETIELQPDGAFYCRLIDLSSRIEDTALIRRWHALMSAMRLWLDAVPGVVVNRPFAGAHNGSKPLHESMLRDLGFQVPESLTSCDEVTLRKFVREAPTISKTVCGTRADTETATEADFEEFDPASGPVHLQRFVTGTDVRIHVIGDELVAQKVATEAVDYRRDGSMADLEAYELSDKLRDLLIAGTRSIGLAFAGWDFKIDDDGTYWCLEANPMPGYGPYDIRCAGAVSRALLRYLGAGVSAG